MSHGSIAAGLRSLLREHGPSVILRKLRRTSLPDQRTHPFDRTYHVDTSGLLYAQDLASGHAHDQHSSGYYATAPSLFQGAIAHWQATLHATGLALPDYTLIDAGCGKGRIVMLASNYPFRAVFGVELSPLLFRVAQKNLKRWMRQPRACRDVQIVNDDVFSVAIPAGPVVLFLFNSFERELVQLLRDKLVEAAVTRSHPIDLLYIHPEHGDLFTHSPGIRLLADNEISFTAEDAAADVFGVAFDQCRIYRLDGERMPDPSR